MHKRAHKRVISAEVAERMAEKRSKKTARTFIEKDKSVKEQTIRFLEDVEIYTKRRERHLPLYSDLLKEYVFRKPNKFEVTEIKLLFKRYARETIEQKFDVSYELEVT